MPVLRGSCISEGRHGQDAIADRRSFSRMDGLGIALLEMDGLGIATRLPAKIESQGFVALGGI